jgi:hypothetical protein
VGYYDGRSSPEPEEKPPGCLETLLITRVVFSLILPVVAVIVLVLIDFAAIIMLFSVHPALALIPLALTAGAIWLFARWERRHFRPPDF